MATITVDTFLDGGTARTAGETWANNGARLTVRTDTRWHANAPAGMLGAVGQVTISTTLGGGFTLDGSKVRWMAFTGGSGVVPAIGTTITRGAVSGYFLGVWASITSAPTAVGAAMPATGFIKLRETTGGLFTAGALTGISATAASPDKPGWIEVVLDQSANIVVPRLGDFTVVGKWFELDATTGAANQLIPVPTNGSSTTYTPGVYIDEAAVNVTAATWLNGVATYTAAGHGLGIPYKGDTTRHAFIQGITPATYNYAEGVDVTIIDANTFTASIAVDPGAFTAAGTVNGHTFYPAIYAAAYLPANLGTDIRSKFVCMETTGSVRVGHNGTSACGFVPPSGRKVRIPNVLGRQCLAASRNLNTIPSATAATRPEISTTSAGVIDVSFFTNDWYFNIVQSYTCKLIHFATFDLVTISEVATALNLFNGGNGHSQALSTPVLSITSCFSGGRITDWSATRVSSAASGNAVSITSCKGQRLTRVDVGILTYARTTSANGIQLILSDSITLYDCSTTNSGIITSTATNIIIDGLDYCDRYFGTTNATSGVYIITAVAASSNVLMRQVTFGKKGVIADNHPYNGILTATQCKDMRLRECGTRSAFLNGGSTLQIAYIFVSGGNNSGIKIQRVYVAPTRTGLFSNTNSDESSVYEHVYGDFADAIAPVELSSLYKNCGGTPNGVAQTSVYGTHFFDTFTSDTVGRVLLACNEASNSTTSLVTTVSGSPKFTSSGNLVMAAVGAELIIEQNYFVLGCLTLANTAPTVSGTNVTYVSNARWGNHDIYYQIDTGAGFGGTWKNLTAANLSTETITPTTGFRLKIRIVCAVASTTNALSFITVFTTTSLAAQLNMYPLDVGTVIVTALASGTRVKASKVTDGTILFNGPEVSGVCTFTTDYIGPITIEARKASSAPFYQPWITQVTTTANATVTATALQQLDQ
jgi:hypothetical protein